MEKEETHLMEDFVRDLFTKTEDFNLLTKKIVRKKYLQYMKQDSLSPEQKSLFADIIVKLLFEFNVGTEKPINQNKNETSTAPAVPEETSDKSVDGSKGKSTDGISENPQETRSSPVPVSCPKTGNDISQNACVAKNKELEKEEEKVVEVEKDENKDVKSVEKKSGLSENEKKLPSKETKNKKRLLFSLQSTKRVLAKQILINNFRDKVKNSQSKFISDKPNPVINNAKSDTATSEHPLTNLSGKPTDDKAVNKEAQNEPVSVGSDNLQGAEKLQKAAPKRLSAFEVLQSVLEDSNDGSVLSKSDSADDDQSSVARSSPVCDSPGNKVNSLIPLEEISDSTPTRRPRRSSKRLLESDNDSTADGFTPPSKVKRIITSDSDSKNSPIRMRLFHNRIVDYSLHVPNATNKKTSDCNSEIQSPIKLLSLTGLSSTDTSPLPLKIKKSSLKKVKALNHSNSTNEITERKTVKPFRISISKKEILRASDSESDAERSPVIKPKKTKPKPKRIKKQTSKHKARSNHAASSSSSCDTDDLKLSQIKTMNQAKLDESSDSDSDLLINYASNRFKEKANNFKIPTAQKNVVAVDGTPPKLRIIHEKSAMDSDSDFNPKKLKSSQSNASVGKVFVIRENAVNSENDCTASKNICDNAQSSSPEKTPQKKVSRKSKSAQILNSDSDDSDLGLRIVLSNSSDSEDVPLARKWADSEISLPSLTESTATSANDSTQKLTVGNKTCSPKVSSDDSPVSGCDMLTTEEKKSITETVGYIKRIQQTGSPRQKNKKESSTNESSHVDVEDSSEESDNVSLQTNKKNNSVYSEDELFEKNLESKRLVVRLERIQADASLLINTNPPNENIIMTSNSQTSASDDPGRLEIDCNGVGSDSDISSHSESMPTDRQPSNVTNHVVEKNTKLKAVPVESDKLKRLKKICRTAELYVKYKKEFEYLKSDAAKCQRLQQILKDAGMQGKPSLKAAERLRLLKEAKELSETNIISSKSAGRTRRKIPDIFTDKSSKNTIDNEPEKFVNLAGIVDSERSENDMELD